MRAVALGNFDGVHLAHMAVLQNAAKAEQSICLLFEKHPLELLTGTAPARILSKEQTEKHILQGGIGECVYLDFAAVKDLSPARFFEEILRNRLHADIICCGYNYSFGKDRQGDVDVLRRLCLDSGIKLEVAARMDYAGAPISSSRIRECIRSGEIEQANAMLGYRYFYAGEIARGKQLGKTLGFPTINQYFEREVLKPAAGVYASRATVGGRQYRALTNIGSNPTVGTDSFRSESYLFDFSQEVYGERATIELERFIRAEQRFEDMNALRAQVLRDIERAKDYV